MLVDDDKQLVKLLCMRFEANNFEVFTASDGSQAMETAKKEKPDLIILDVLLPEMDGYWVCESIRADPELKQTPIIMLTCLDKQIDERLGRLAGAHVYLTKPFDATQLLEKVQELLS